MEERRVQARLEGIFGARAVTAWERGVLAAIGLLLLLLAVTAVASLSPGDVRRLGIQAGEFIRVKTRRGAIEMKARRDPTIPDGVVFIPFCYAEAAANVLTSPELDPIGKIPEFKFCAARIETV